MFGLRGLALLSGSVSRLVLGCVSVKPGLALRVGVSISVWIKRVSVSVRVKPGLALRVRVSVKGGV